MSCDYCGDSSSVESRTVQEKPVELCERCYPALTVAAVYLEKHYSDEHGKPDVFEWIINATPEGLGELYAHLAIKKLARVSTTDRGELRADFLVRS
ncbi:hypothetical protein [Frankia tisae]|uniref:hypothetical protein n=1 Tax=Frankia tisae TaxID=2950104 RepID=UPI0021C19388|nr:hypothetical protein [Frankia tisae]